MLGSNLEREVNVEGSVSNESITNISHTYMVLQFLRQYLFETKYAFKVWFDNANDITVNISETLF